MWARGPGLKEGTHRKESNRKGESETIWDGSRIKTPAVVVQARFVGYGHRNGSARGGQKGWCIRHTTLRGRKSSSLNGKDSFLQKRDSAYGLLEDLEGQSRRTGIQKLSPQKKTKTKQRAVGVMPRAYVKARIRERVAHPLASRIPQ